VGELERIRSFEAPLHLGQEGQSGTRLLATLDEVNSTSMPFEYFQIAMRHKGVILGLALAGLLASLMFSLTTQPVYQTRTSLDIQTLNSDFLNMKSVDPTASTPTDTAIQTQIKLLESDSLADRVNAALASEPHPDAIHRTDLLSRLKRGLHLGSTGSIPFAALLNETANGVKVKPLGITQLVEITCDSWDEKFGVEYCNTLTNQFQQQDLETRGDAAKRTSEWLMHQAADIREKAEQSQQRLIAATGGNGLILSQQSSEVGTDALRDLQSELVKAQANRMEVEAELATARSSSANTLPTSAQSPGYTAERARLADLQAQVSALVPPLTEANPRVIRLRAQIRDAQQAIDQESTNGEDRLQGVYQAAKHREDLLRAAYGAKEGSVSSDMEKATNVDLLRREVQSEQQLYETLLQRAKEAGFAAAMQATTIRVVDAARSPLLPIYPRRLTSAAIGILLGTLTGLLFAFVKDRNTVVLRQPGESERLLHISELGVVPSPQVAVGGSGGPRSGIGRLTLPAARRSGPPTTEAWSAEFSLLTEAYRGITQSLLMSERTRGNRTYIVMSPNAGEGKTTVVAHLGVALSKAKLRVVLIDADLRKSTLHTVLGVPNEFGLSNLLEGGVISPEDWARRACVPTSFSNLYLIPSGAGAAEVMEILHSQRLPALLESLTQEFDVVLIDTPPMLHIADARILAGSADGAILVFRAGMTTRNQARNARVLLDRDRVHIVGSILNDFNPTDVGQYGYYRSYYAYEQGSRSRTTHG
jgi:succinoglycan biosynthesis transport protein ExoP